MYGQPEPSKNTIGRAGKPWPKGVFADKGRFVVRPNDEGKRPILGRFDSPAEAHAVYCAWARAKHGEFFNPGPAKPSIFD